MPLTYKEFGIYGVQTVFYFSVEEPLGVSSDRFFNAAVPWVAGDVTISKDGGAFANVTNLPVRIGATQLYALTLTATEMQALRIDVLLVDVTAGAAWRDALIQVQTRLQLGSLDLNASQLAGIGLNVTAGGNNPAGKFTGAGTPGPGLQLTGDFGAGLLAEALSANNPGIQANGVGTGAGLNVVGGPTNGNGILASGQGSGAGVKGQGGATGVGVLASGGATSGSGLEATALAGNSAGAKFTAFGTGIALHLIGNTVDLITNLFEQTEGAQPSGAIGASVSFRTILQHLKRRFTNRVTQTSTVQTVYQDDNTTILEQGTCSDDGTTQTKGRFV